MSTIRLSDGLVVSAESVLRDPASWSPAMVSAAKAALALDEIRTRSGATPKVTTVGVAHQEHAVEEVRHA